MFKKIKINIKIEVLASDKWNELKTKQKEEYINQKMLNKNIIKFIKILKD